MERRSGGAGAHPRRGDNGLSAPTLFPHLLGKGGGGGNNTILAVCGDAKYPHMVGTQLESVASSCSQPRETQEKTDPAAHSATPRQQVHDPDRRALLPGLGHRPAPLLANGGADWTPPSSSASQWWGGMGTALIPSGPIVTWPGARAAPQPGGEAGGRPLAPPHSPLTRCLVSPSSCSKPRGRAGGRRGCASKGGSRGHYRRLQPGSRSPYPSEVAAPRLSVLLPRARTWRPRRTPSATRDATSCASVWSCPP